MVVGCWLLFVVRRLFVGCWLLVGWFVGLSVGVFFAVVFGDCGSWHVVRCLLFVGVLCCDALMCVGVCWCFLFVVCRFRGSLFIVCCALCVVHCALRVGRCLLFGVLLLFVGCSVCVLRCALLVVC